MFNHGVSSAMLFLVVGVIYERAHHRDLTRFGGIGLQMPWYTGIATVGFFASLGLPGLNGFISEFLCFLGAYGQGDQGSLITTEAGISSPWIVYVSLLGVVLGAVYILWTIQRVYLGPITREEYKRFPDVSFREILVLAPLALLCIVLGIFPRILIDFMNGSLVSVTDMVRGSLGQ
jgi:NADH-quinone oxidoreductase subunit M